MQVCYFGTYDIDQPRTRVLIEGLQKSGVEVSQYHVNLWQNTSHKVKFARHPERMIKELRKILPAYYSLFRELKALKDCDVVIFGHMGQLDLLLTAWWFRYHEIPVVWDALISLFDTVVDDRQLLSSRSIWAWILWKLDRLSGMYSDVILTDTQQNCVYWKRNFSLPSHKIHVVPVGAEDMFHRYASSNEPEAGCTRVLFYGKYAPLHGVETIIEAASCLRANSKISWTLVGRGQERIRAERLVDRLGLQNIDFVDWIPYESLPEKISFFDIGLGIFGSTNKAKRVCPNKAYQILAAGRPLITGDTPAAREILWKNGLKGALLVTPGDAKELASAVCSIRDCYSKEIARAGSELYRRYYSSEVIGRQVKRILSNVIVG